MLPSLPRALSLVTPLSLLGLGLVAPAAAQQAAPLPPLVSPSPPSPVAVPSSGGSVVVLPPGQQVVLQTTPPPAQYVLVEPGARLAPQAAPASTGPEQVNNWDENRPTPPGYHVEKRTRVDMVAAGASLFGALYLVSIFAAAVGQDATSPGGSNPVAGLWVPGVGPFIAMPHTGTATGNLFLALDGIVQLGGIGMFAYGLASPRVTLRKNEFGLNLHVVPVVAPGQQGLALGGSF